MIPQLLVGAGLVGLAAGLGVLATFGERFRIGRLVGGTPRVSVADALALAKANERRYVRVEGRIDSEEEFEDELHRPLVFRRERIDLGNGSGWKRLDERRRAVEFEVREGVDAIGVDHDALGEGLVVIPREAVGTAAEVRAMVGDRIADPTPVRLRIEQVSSVEHAIVLGQPRLGPHGRAELTAGLGRPLVLTTLETPEAMRILASGARVRPALAAVLLAIGTACLALGIALLLVESIT